MQMRKGRKPRSTPAQSLLCVAVRCIRENAGWSQDEMAKKTNIAPQTISRMELGKQTPRDEFVLMALSDAAADAGLDAEEKLFDQAVKNHPGTRLDATIVVQTYTPQQWRLMQAARIADLFFPDVAKAIERAAGSRLNWWMRLSQRRR